MSEPRRVVITGHGVTGTVELDGVEIQKGLASATLTIGGGELPRLRVEPIIVTAAADIDGHVRVHVPERAHDTLVALGWTPPPGPDCAS